MDVPRTGPVRGSSPEGSRTGTGPDLKALLIGENTRRLALNFVTCHCVAFVDRSAISHTIRPHPATTPSNILGDVADIRTKWAIAYYD